MLGIRELVIITFFVVIPVLIALSIWQAVKRNTGPAARLARLEELRVSGKITSAEYERQRASIISGV